MNHNHVSATIGIRAVDPRILADDKFIKRMGNFDRVCKQIDAKYDNVMEMLANIQEQLCTLEMKQRRENGVKFCAGDAQFQNEKAAIKPNPSLSPLFSTFQPSPQTPPPPLLTTLKKPYSIETPSAKPLTTALSSQIETLAILCTPKPQNIAMVVVNPKAIEPPLISSAYADITEGSNGALVIKEFHESSLDVSGNREKIETNLVEFGVQAMEEMSEWVVVSDSAMSAEQTNPSREILQQIKASSDTKKTKCRILAEWAEEPPDIPNYQPSPFKGKPNTLQEKMAAKILVMSPMLNVFDEMTKRELSSSKEETVCMDLGEKIHAHMKTDLYRVSVATSVEDFGKKCTKAMQVFDPGGSALDVRVLKFLRLLGEDSGDVPSETADNETALVSAIEAMSSRLELSPTDYDSKKERQLNYEKACREKFATPEETQELQPEERDKSQEINVATSKSEQAVRQSIIESDGRPMEEAAMVGYQKKVTVLYELLSACLADTPADSKMSTKRRKGYDARHRVALRLLATWFDVKWTKMEAIETIVACTAMALLKEEESKEEGQLSESSWEKWKRGGIIGAPALTGGTLIAITGGLAAPSIAAGFGALAPTLGTIIPVIGASGFAAVASAAGSVAGSVAVAASFGAAGAGLTGSKVATRIGDVDEFEFKAIGDNHNQGRLAVEISVSGFVFEEEDFIRPWEAQHENLERYALQWESKHLYAVSTAIQDWLTSKIASEMMKRGAMMTVLSTLATALAWPVTLLSLTDFIDSKWTIAIDRSDKAGKMLAEEVLLKGLQGHRPVTLVGFSLGARVIFRCLQILAESETNAGLVERVVLLGAPIPIKDVNWEATRKVVAGRYVNVYSTNDWMLGIAFRANLLTRGLAGIQPVDAPGIENVDATEIIDGHSSYLWRAQQILDQLELDTYYPVFNREAVKP